MDPPPTPPAPPAVPAPLPPAVSLPSAGPLPLPPAVEPILPDLPVVPMVLLAPPVVEVLVPLAVSAEKPAPLPLVAPAAPEPEVCARAGAKPRTDRATGMAIMVRMNIGFSSVDYYEMNLGRNF